MMSNEVIAYGTHLVTLLKAKRSAATELITIKEAERKILIDEVAKIDINLGRVDNYLIHRTIAAIVTTAR